MGTVIIGIGHDDDLAVMDVPDVEILTIACTDGIDEGGDFLVAKEDLLIEDLGGVLRLSTER